MGAHFYVETEALRRLLNGSLSLNDVHLIFSITVRPNVAAIAEKSLGPWKDKHDSHETSPGVAGLLRALSPMRVKQPLNC
jgi:hypothetical protein